MSITGPVRLSNATLAGFDTSSKLSAIPGVGGKQSGSKDTKIQNCSTTVRMASDNVQADAINVNIPSLGIVTGGGSINPSGALNFCDERRSQRREVRRGWAGCALLDRRHCFGSEIRTERKGTGGWCGQAGDFREGRCHEGRRKGWQKALTLRDGWHGKKILPAQQPVRIEAALHVHHRLDVFRLILKFQEIGFSLA